MGLWAFQWARAFELLGSYKIAQVQSTLEYRCTFKSGDDSCFVSWRDALWLDTLRRDCNIAWIKSELLELDKAVIL